MDEAQGRASRRQDHFARMQGTFPLPIMIDDLALPNGGRLDEDEFVVRVGKDWSASVKPLILTSKRLVCPRDPSGREVALVPLAEVREVSIRKHWVGSPTIVVEAAGGTRVISFGARHVHPLVGPIMEYSAIVGGCNGCATPLGAQLAGLAAPSGTMPHAMILIFGDTVQAGQAFDRHMAPDVLRIVLVDTFKDEAEEALRVAAAMQDRLRGVRLDTPFERGRVTVDLVREVRARLDQAGHPKVGIFVSGGMTVERIRQFVAAKAAIDSFGVGMEIAAAPPVGFTADIKEVDGEPRTKRGRIPGITAAPRLKKVI